MKQFVQTLSARTTNALPKLVVLGAVLLTSAGCAVVGPPPPPAPYYVQPYIHSYYDYPPYYTYWTGPSVYLNYHDDGFHRGRGYHRGRR